MLPRSTTIAVALTILLAGLAAGGPGAGAADAPTASTTAPTVLQTNDTADNASSDDASPSDSLDGDEPLGWLFADSEDWGPGSETTDPDGTPLGWLFAESDDWGAGTEATDPGGETTATPTPTATPTATPTPTPTPTTTTTTTPTPTPTATPTPTPTTTPTPDPADPDDPGVSTYDVDGTTIQSDEVERLIHERVNDLRAGEGRSTLGYSDAVASVARAHSEDMADRDYFSHTNPDGEAPWDRYDGVEGGPACDGYGENIAVNWVGVAVRTGDGTHTTYETNEEIARALVNQWMGSDGHRRNLLSASWDAEGVGVYVTDEGQVYATQNFCG